MPETMIFTLTRSYKARSYSNTQLTSDIVNLTGLSSDSNWEEREVVGFITLYHDNYLGYAAGWRQTVGMINEYLQLAVLHLQLLSNRFDQAQDFAKHELRHQAIYIRNSLRKLNKQNDFIRDATLPNAIENIFDDFGAILTEAQKNNENYKQLQELVKGVVRTARASQATHNNLMANTSLFDERIDRLSQIENLEYFGVGVDETKVVIEIRQFIANFVKAYRSILTQKGVYVDISSMTHFRVSTYDSLINHIFTNILQNANQYCQSDSVIDIRSDIGHGVKKKAVMTISNLAPYDNHVSAAELLSYGRRGSWAQYSNSHGNGIGLWAVNRACDLAGIKMGYIIEPINNKIDATQYPLARHSIRLNFTSVMV